jgi:type IV secretion system protein VirB10
VPSAATTVDPSAARIEEYKQRIQEEAQKLQQEKAQLARTQGVLASVNRAASLSPTLGGAAPTSLAEAGHYRAPELAIENSFESDRRKRDDQSLFVSNIALSYRKEPTPPTKPAAVTPESAAQGLAAYAVCPAPVSPTVSSAQPAPEPRAVAEAIIAKDKPKSRDSGLERASGQSYRLFEGTVIETVLTNRLDGSFSGPVNCMVTTNVYSHSGQHLLIPQGSRVLGEVKKVDAFGQQRLAVSFHRLIMPDGYALSLDKFQGLNQIGETGLRDQVNHHYLQVFGVSLAIGAIAGLSQANTRYSVNESAADVYRQGVSASLAQSSMQILDRYLNVLPTFTIREGQRVKIYLSGDLLLPAYAHHEMPDDL